MTNILTLVASYKAYIGNPSRDLFYNFSKEYDDMYVTYKNMCMVHGTYYDDNADCTCDDLIKLLDDDLKDQYGIDFDKEHSEFSTIWHQFIH